MENKEYEWVVVGGGIAGIVIAEILTREGHDVLLIEKNNKLAGETTKGFHEWIHTGALYTLLPDNLLTVKYVIGAIDDLLEYYSSFENMNLVPTEEGLVIDGNDKWFKNNYIHFKFRLKNRKIFFPWLLLISRSMYLINVISKHDWLRRRAGIIEHFKLTNWKILFKNFINLLFISDPYLNIKTSDFTTNSRVVLYDLVDNAMGNGLKVITDAEVVNIEKTNDANIISLKNGVIKSKNIVLSVSKEIGKFVDASISTTYAPIAVVNGLNEESVSFVELDYFTKNCINMLVKENGYGLAGGISLDKIEDCDEYLDYVIARHKQEHINLEVQNRYIGEKNEIIFNEEERNYLYHINDHGNNIWSVIPGKFTLGFSFAPEFYRRIYKRNPSKNFNTHKSNSKDIISDTYWMEAMKGHNNGNDKDT